ncbi:toxin secretion/phage lysis holin [Acetoanaerobium pronyense]|uniref:Toxin secretion/phage lysis holin n=1 Tax=Acetoanaerobium pronyense TaxID=1482736 RepID=A0ABS4KQ00_9FIRM|nr:phage holin family protein [Acetoanaerobium pronyense]MBP2028684.1 toxin secretion/phage lysis holin [Acetoanaerobium pronyense]
MKELVLKFQLITAGIGGFLGWTIGGIDSIANALVAFVVIDYLTGVMVAILERRLSSNIGFHGIIKKVMIFVFVGIGHIFDTKIIGDGGAVRTAIIFFYISNEGISIVENAAKIGLPVPEKLRNAILSLKSEEEKHYGNKN